MLCAPPAAEYLLQGTLPRASPCPPWDSCCILLSSAFEGLTLFQAANVAVNGLGVISPGSVVPCSHCPSSSASRECLSQDGVARWGVWGVCLSLLAPDIQEEHVQGIFLPVQTGTEG